MPQIDYYSMTLKQLKESARVYDLKTLQDKASMEYRLTIHQKLIDEGPGIDKEQHRNELNDYTIPQLKAMLTYYHMKTTGPKKDLVRMLLELPMAKIDLPGKIPKSNTKKQETMKAVEEVTQLKKSIQDRIARVKAIRDTVVKPTATQPPAPVSKPMTTETDKFDSKRNGIIRLLEKVAVDPAKYQSDLSSIREVVNKLEKLATTESHRKTIKRFRLILKKLLIVVPLEESIPSMEPISKGIAIKRPPPKKLLVVEPLVEAIPSMEPISKGIVIKRPPRNKEVPKNIAPVISKLQTDLEELQSIGMKSVYNKKEFDPSNLLTEYFFLSMLSKYKNPAVIIDIKQKQSKYTYPTRTGIHVFISYKQTDYDFKLDVEYLGKQLKYYKNIGVDVICIPFNFNYFGMDGLPVAHANMLIYRPKMKVVDHFEPHGARYTSEEDNISYIIQDSLENLWENQLTPFIGKVSFVSSKIVCPRIRGLQGLANDEACALWSCFIAEFALLNPTMSTPTIMSEIFSIIKDDKTYAKNIIYGYITKAEQFSSKLLKKKVTYMSVQVSSPITRHHRALDIMKDKNPQAYGALIHTKI